MYCSECGKEVLEKQTFCRNCGNSLVKLERSSMNLWQKTGIFSLVGSAAFIAFSFLTIAILILGIPLNHIFALFFILGVILVGKLGVSAFEKRELKKQLTKFQQEQISGTPPKQLEEKNSFQKIWSVIDNTTSKLPHLVKKETSGELKF